MPAYLITHKAGQRGDILVEDPALTLELRQGWAILADTHGVCLAIPAEHITAIQRVDEPAQPAPDKEA